MEHLLLAVIAILLTVIFALLGKIYLMHKATLEIGEAFEVKLAAVPTPSSTFPPGPLPVPAGSIHQHPTSDSAKAAAQVLSR